LIFLRRGILLEGAQPPTKRLREARLPKKALVCIPTDPRKFSASLAPWGLELDK
jgi:hypothetical protein